MTTGKTIALTRQTLVGKEMSLLFKMLSRLVITFLPRSKHLLISWLQSPSAVILEPPKMSDTVSTVSHEVTGPDAIVLVFWMNDKRREHIKNQRNYFINKNLSSQSYGFSSGHVWMWELDRLTKDWAPKNWCFWTVVLEIVLRALWTARSNQSMLRKSYLNIQW